MTSEQASTKDLLTANSEKGVRKVTIKGQFQNKLGYAIRPTSASNFDELQPVETVSPVKADPKLPPRTAFEYRNALVSRQTISLVGSEN